MFTICTGKEEINSQKNSISGISQKIGLEKRLYDDFDKVITGEIQGNKEDFIDVIDFDLLDCFRDEEKIIICGKDFRRMFFLKYKIFSSENGTLIRKKGICVTILTLLFVGMFAKFASMLFAIHDFRISASIYAILAVMIFHFFYNFKKSKEEMNEIDMLLMKVIEQPAKALEEIIRAQALPKAMQRQRITWQKRKVIQAKKNEHQSQNE